MLGFQRSPIPLMELVGGKEKLKEKMGQPSILAENRITTGDLPSKYLVRKNALTLVSIGKILQSLEGCACPMGVLSREFLNKLDLESNEIAIVDMEAGVEHFGRGIDTGIDNILLVVEPSLESIAAAEKIKGFAAEINKNIRAVLNKINSDALALKLKNELRGRKIEVVGVIPDDPVVFGACLEGYALDRGEAFQAAGKILNYLLSQKLGEKA
jgi:CO dehydrogenase maturation factor